MPRRLVESHAAFRLLLVLPWVGMLIQFARLQSWSLLIAQSGEWSVRLLILTLAVSPVRIVMKQLRMGPHWPNWLMKRRRELGMACFLYALLHLSFYGHVGDSNVHICVSALYADGEDMHSVDDIVYGVLGRYHGSISAEHGIGTLKRPYLHLSRSPAELALMKGLKQALDPKGILNPGKVI